MDRKDRVHAMLAGPDHRPQLPALQSVQDNLGTFRAFERWHQFTPEQFGLRVPQFVAIGIDGLHGPSPNFADDGRGGLAIQLPYWQKAMFDLYVALQHSDFERKVGDPWDGSSFSPSKRAARERRCF